MVTSLTPERQAQIERILADPLFNQSRRCASFLRFVVEHGQTDAGEPLTERLIGVKALGRTPDYDTEADPIVRVTASEVRKRLAQYYDNPTHSGELRVVVHKGSYLAEFVTPETQVSAPPVMVHAEPVLLTPEPVSERRSKSPNLLLAVACVAILAAGAWFLLRPKPSNFEKFWNPVLNGHPRVLVSYQQPSTNWKIMNGAVPEMAWTDRLTPQPSYRMDWPSFMRIFVDKGQIAIVSRISEYLGSQGKHVSIKEASELSMRDLRETPAVILGGFNNDWTSRLLPQARFYFDGEGTLRFIADRQRPGNRQWNFDTKTVRDKDLIIISRISDPETGRVTLFAGGFSYWGTEAAVEFVTNPSHLQVALAQLPNGWEDKNLQLVLWCSVVQGTPDLPKFLAAHTW